MPKQHGFHVCKRTEILNIMGLDICIYAKDHNNKELEGYYELSRDFCRLICDLIEGKDIKPELQQLFDQTGTDISIIKKMNVWDFFSNETSDLTKKEIENYYDQAWQKVNDVLVIINKLYQEIESKPLILKSLNFHTDWVANYFNDFLKNKGSLKYGRNFGWDLRIVKSFLDDLEPNTMVRFHFY